MAARLALLFAWSGSALALTPSELATRAQFEQWKLDYGKGYATSDEEASRFALWSEAVAQSGAGALSPYTDLTADEYRAIFPPRNADDPALRWGLGDAVVEYPYTYFSDEYVKAALAEGKDWRAEGAVTECKSQGSQGTCGTFGQTQDAESQYFLGGGGANPDKAPHDLVQFSEQMLLSCKTGDQTDSYFFLEVGIEPTDSYPYNTTDWPTDEPPPCHLDEAKLLPDSIFSNITSVPLAAGEEQLAAFVHFNGPVQIGIASSVFQGVNDDHFVTPDNCGNFTSIDHSVGAVGFGTSDEYGDYWIIKNSWSPTWQDHGFIYIARGVRCGNIFASGAHVYTYGDPAYYYEASTAAAALA